MSSGTVLAVNSPSRLRAQASSAAKSVNLPAAVQSLPGELVPKAVPLCPSMLHICAPFSLVRLTSARS